MPIGYAQIVNKDSKVLDYLEGFLVENTYEDKFSINSEDLKVILNKYTEIRNGK